MPYLDSGFWTLEWAVLGLFYFMEWDFSSLMKNIVYFHIVNATTAPVYLANMLLLWKTGFVAKKNWLYFPLESCRITCAIQLIFIQTMWEYKTNSARNIRLGCTLSWVEAVFIQQNPYFDT